MKIVINKCYGGFGLSHEAMMRYAEIKGITFYVEEDQFGMKTYWKTPKESRLDLILDESRNWSEMPIEKRQEFNRRYSEETLYANEIDRTDPALIQVVEELGKEADGQHAELKVVVIDDDVNWYIEEYDGTEWIAERHRTWS